jgi:hypothetical protein
VPQAGHFRQTGFLSDSLGPALLASEGEAAVLAARRTQGMPGIVPLVLLL